MLQPSWEELLTFSSEMVFITLYLLSNLIIDEVVTTTIRSATLVFTFTCSKLKCFISSRFIQQGRNEGWCCSMNFLNWQQFQTFCTRCISLKAWDLIPPSVFLRFRPGVFPHATEGRYWKTNFAQQRTLLVRHVSYKKLEVMQPRIRIKSELPVGE